MSLVPKKTCGGDTLIEILFATAIFGAVAVGTVSIINSTLALSEGNVEQTITRNEIDAQAEAIRYIYATEQNSDDTTSVWKSIVDKAISPNESSAEDISNYPVSTCSDIYDDESGTIKNNKAFIVNTRTTSQIISSSKLTSATTYPHLNYDNDTNNYLNSAEGVWVFVVKSADTNPEYYDFYIRSCWYTPNESAPTTIGTVIRLHNPDYEYATGEINQPTESDTSEPSSGSSSGGGGYRRGSCSNWGWFSWLCRILRWLGF